VGHALVGINSAPKGAVRDLIRFTINILLLTERFIFSQRSIYLPKISMLMRKSLKTALRQYCFLGAVAIVLLVPRIAASQTVNIDRIVAELEPEIQRTLLAGNIPSASIALVSGNQVVWTGAYGHSNLWARTPAAPNTVYLIGSTFKAMSTVALLQQMEQGKFKLDDRVNDYLTDFKIQGEDPQRPVTFRHLLTHTSGLPGDSDRFRSGAKRYRHRSTSICGNH
jgi:CubicO group peptidase (beta-lactamase class C family)